MITLSERNLPVSAIVLRTFERLDFPSLESACLALKVVAQQVVAKQGHRYRGHYFFDPRDPDEPDMQVCEDLSENPAKNRVVWPHQGPVWISDTHTGSGQRYPSRSSARDSIGKFQADLIDSGRLYRRRYLIWELS